MSNTCQHIFSWTASEFRLTCAGFWKVLCNTDVCKKLQDSPERISKEIYSIKKRKQTKKKTPKNKNMKETIYRGDKNCTINTGAENKWKQSIKPPRMYDIIFFFLVSGNIYMRISFFFLFSPFLKINAGIKKKPQTIYSTGIVSMSPPPCRGYSVL